ncbi:MAG: thermonuclease family protein, partial [Microcoleaceae cyanobacterium]
NTPGRNYRLLSNWWCLRASIVEDYRRYGKVNGILSVRDDFPAILEVAKKEESITIFADLQDGIKTWLSSGAIIYDGIRNRQLKLWIPDANHANQKPLIQLLQNRYCGIGRGYAYITGYMCMYRDKPEMILESLDQISDFPDQNNSI